MNRCNLLILLILVATGIPALGTAEGENNTPASLGYLQIHTQVDGARVYFDRQFMGFIENGSLSIPVDTMASPQYSNLIIEYSKYRSFVGKLPEPVAGKSVGVMVTLNQTGYEQMGVIMFESGIPGAELFLNGKSAGITPDSGILMIQTVPNGLYNCTVKRSGNLSITDQQYVSSNAFTPYRVVLQPATIGDVSITSTPGGAGIYIDNRYVGLSPLSVPDIPVGNVQVKLKLEGFQEYLQEVLVTGSDPAKVDAVLVSLPPTPNQTPDCPTPNETPTMTPIPTQPPGMVLPEINGNMTLYAGIVVLIGLVGCAVIGVVYYRRKP